jgi:hypothetical protein
LVAERFAERVRGDENLKTVEAQIARMFRLALNREATSEELARAEVFIGNATESQRLAGVKLDTLRGQIADANAKVTAIREPVRERLFVKRNTNGQPTSTGPKPLASWDFSVGTKDQLGQLHLSLIGGARVEGGALVLDGRNAFARSAPLAKPLRAKTLEAWVQLSNLDQRGGGVVSVQTRDGVLFDAIVFAEKKSQRWLAGSDGFTRTESFRGPAEKQATGQPVHVALVYRADGVIIGYRNGESYGRSYKTGLQSFTAGNAEVLFGLRHGIGAGGNRMLAGKILKARLYDRALEPGEVTASFGGNPNFISERDLLAAMTEKQRMTLAELTAALEKLNGETVVLKNTGASAADPLRELAQAMFNLKEFIYLQ